MDENKKKTAYLQLIKFNNQCELTFDLDVELEGIGKIKEEIKAVRQSSDTVQSLLQYTANKLKKSIQLSRENNQDVKIQIALKWGLIESPIKGDLTLKELINCDIKNIVFEIFHQRYFLVIKVPIVRQVSLPQVLYAPFVVQPIRLQSLFTNNDKKFAWYKSKNKKNWEKVGECCNYKISNNDVGHYLKFVCWPCNGIMTGPPVEVISETVVDVIGILPICPFEQRHKFTSHKLKGDRMVSYNVLSSRYTETNESFPYCPPKALAVDYRKQLISKELIGYNADLMCLQEVDMVLFKSYYKEVFKEKTFHCFYHRKGYTSSEGLACFFNTSRFSKISDFQIIFRNEVKRELFSHVFGFLKSNLELHDCFMKQMTSLHVTVLKIQHHTLIIGNTHLYYHPEAKLIRLLQIHMATLFLEKISKQHITRQDNTKVILCGDFNSTPTSPVIEYLTNGIIRKDHDLLINWKNKKTFTHRFKFKSALGFPKYTNYTLKFKDCLDYIFIERDKIKINNKVPFPKVEDLAAFEGLPNEVYPSDHLPLVVDLQFA